MGWLIGAGVLSVLVLAAWLIVQARRRPAHDVRMACARDLFHQQREWLEARFLSSITRVGSDEALRWESAHWHDEVLWARDRQTGQLLALVCVHFEPRIFDPPTLRRHATALFEFRKGRWHAEGKRLDELRPDEAIVRDQRFETLSVPPPHPRGVV